MKGSVRVTVSTKKLRYELNLRRNITILQGDSAAFGADMQIVMHALEMRKGTYIDKMEKLVHATGLFD